MRTNPLNKELGTESPARIRGIWRRGTSALLIALTGLAFAQEADDRLVLIPWGKVPKNDAKEVPLFFNANADVRVSAGLKELTSTQRISFKVHQGKAECLSLALTGPGEVMEVSSPGLRDWAVRVGDQGNRFLDIRPLPVDGKAPMAMEVTVKTRSKVENAAVGVLLPAPGSASGFSLSITAEPAADAGIRVEHAGGLVPVAGEDTALPKGRRPLKYLGSGVADLRLRISPADADAVELEIFNTALTGRPAPDRASVSFRLTGTARARKAGASIPLLGGGAALSEGASGDGWHVALRRAGDQWVHDLVADRAGDLPLELAFEVPTRARGDWKQLGFDLPAGVMVPVLIEGLGKSVEFDAALSVVPEVRGEAWQGHLPPSGRVEMAWHPAGKVADGSLFFSSTETTDVRVGSGLLRQMSVVDLRVLQGKITGLVIDLTGPGEVLSVSGKAVTGWSVRSSGGVRQLDVRLARPIENVDRVVIEAQAALGGFPVRAEALRIVPSGALRHSGTVRVANDGAVRVEVLDGKGLVQLAPAQFPGGIDESLRQVFVYRFPSADYSYAVGADQVLPEVGVTETTVYELGETDRRVIADLELDIREAPLRDWEFDIPVELAVASVGGESVADFVPSTEVRDGKRRVKVIFKQAVIDRHLVHVVLERNESAKAGSWMLQPLEFPGAKSRRGFIGAVAAAGYRLTNEKFSGMAEVPVAFFPKKTPGLQQSFRLREADWSATLKVEALGQSVEADVFHLYSLKSGAVYGSVLINYFVVGAPSNEWRVSVPKGIGNIDVTGQNVGRDWRREGDTVIVPLSRPLLGTGTLLLTFEQSMNSLGDRLSPGEVRPLGVQGERGYVQVVSPLQVRQSAVAEGALLKIDASELPAEFRLLSTHPSLGVWQYTARDFKIGMKIDWYAPGETTGQVVDFQKLVSRVSRDGQWVTDATVFVKSRGRSALRMVFPDGAKLWEARVDGEAVNARSDGAATLLPLPPRMDPNQSVEVSLRYGGGKSGAARVNLTAPKLDVPVVVGEWQVSGDKGRQLVPCGGTADMVGRALPEDGWEWLGRNGMGASVLLLAGLAALLVGAGDARGMRLVFSVALGLVFVVGALWMGVASANSTRDGSSVLEYAAPVVSANQVVSVEVSNVPSWVARSGWGVWLGFILGIAAAVAGFVRADRWWLGCGLVLVISAFLSIHGGVPLFFLVLAMVGAAWCLPRIAGFIRSWRRAKPVAAAAVALLVVWAFPGDARAEVAAGIALKPAESVVHEWSIREGRLYGTVDVAVRGEAGDRFLLMGAPAVLGGFQGQGLRVVKAKDGDADAYWLVLDSAGKAGGRAVFEMPLGDPVKGWHVPGGPAAMRSVTLRWDQSGWEFTCVGAARVARPADLKPEQSGAVIVLGPVDAPVIMAKPKQRDAASEDTRFFAEVSNLFLPGAGVVNGRHLLEIRPAQGKVTSLIVKVPEGFTVSDVGDGPVGSWRFDPAKRELAIAVEPAQNEGFSLTVDTQRGAGALPVKLQLEPMRVSGAAGEVGFLGLAYGDEVQPESVVSVGLSQVNPEDFKGALLPRGKDGRPLALLQSAFRYGAGEVKATVTAAAVAPELRCESYQLVSLGEDRLFVVADLAVTISRSGVFRLDLDVPEGLEIESATGDGLGHWSENRADGKRVVTLHLSGKTMGKRAFSIAMTGRPVNPQEKWMVPRVSLRGASRENGMLTVAPERGLQVRAVHLHKLSQMAARDLENVPKDTARAAARPGALTYRMLERDAALGLAISRLDPWVTAKVFHEATIREGQMLSKISISYRIENAATKSQVVGIPGLDSKSAATVRATGADVAELVPVPGKDGFSEIRFQRGIAAETTVVLEYQRPNPEGAREKIEQVVLEGVRQQNYHVAVRAGGRLELAAGEVPRGWQRTDWSVVQSGFGRAPGMNVPVLVFRVADTREPLPVVLVHHELASLRKHRVSQGELITLLSPRGDAMTSVNLRMRVLAKETLRLRLPEGAGLFNVFVNDEGANLVREGGDWLFHVFPSPDAGRETTVRFVYSSSMRGGKRLEGPLLDLPMENLTWKVIVPEGWRLSGHGGDFDLKSQSVTGGYQLEDYRSFMSGKRERDARSAIALLDQANSYLAAGDQEKAGIALGNAARNGQLDAASNEDARVQLRELKTQQAVLGLNTRRQKVFLDNRVAAPTQGANPMLDRAAEVNPVLRGAYNFDPKQFDRFLEGNTADENAALKEIANRIVNQQLAAEGAPTALEVVLPERGTVLSFGRSVQAEADRPMAVELKFKRSGGAWFGVAVMLCLLAGAMGVVSKANRAGETSSVNHHPRA